MDKKLIATFVVKYVLIVWPLALLGMIILPFVLAFVPRHKETLPRAFRWFDNHEAHIGHLNDNKDIDGLLGPTSERIKIGALNEDGTINESFGYLRLLWNRYRWIALRNPVYYFQHVVMGIRVTDDIIIEDEISDVYPDGLRTTYLDQYDTAPEEVVGHSTSKEYFESMQLKHYYVGEKAGYRKGWYYTTYKNIKTGKRHFEFYAVLPYGKTGYGLRLRVGVKVRNLRQRPFGYVVPTEMSITLAKKMYF